MNRVLILFVLGVLVGCAGVSSGNLQKKHFFWKVSDDNSSVWILGSLHFADSTFYPLDEVIENAFASSEELAVEINVGDDSLEREIVERSMTQGLLPAGKTLNEILPRPVWTTLDSICTAWNFPMAPLMKMRPWLVATTLSAVAIQRTGIDPNYGVDMVLLDRAATEGKAISSLETVDEQVGALADSGDSDSSGIYYLKTTLHEISKLDSMVAQMVRAWKFGDDELMRKVLSEEDFFENQSDEKLRDAMKDKVYGNRNEKMTRSIEQILSEDRNAFIVVGTAHLLLDDDNVIALLKKRGYKVERF